MIRFSLTLLFGLLIAVANSDAAGPYLKGGGSSPAPPPPPTNEEFAGPFASWACARTAASGTCGAAAAAFCNAGASGGDDTSAVQACYDLLAAGTVKNVWFPAGIYNISSTITLHTKQTSMGVICADPATTTIKWIGSAGGTMFLFNGVALSHVDRCTLDANTVNSAAYIIDQTWDNNGSTGNSDNHDQYADDVFKNAAKAGFKCGSTPGVGQCSEIPMLRDQFINNANGVILCEFNALDVWIWYSTFTNNAIGVSNGSGLPNGCSTTDGGAGNFHVFNSIFTGSTNTDIQWGNAGIFNIRNNYSSGSNKFIASGGGNGPDLALIQGNTVNTPTQQLSVVQQDWGPTVFLDNIIKSPSSGGSTPIVQLGNSSADAFSMGNTFNAGVVSSTCAGSSPVQLRIAGRCHSVNDTVTTIGSLPAPTLPGVPPNNGRTIYEPASFTGAAIQTAINNAVAGATTKPVVHLPAGTYSTSATITVPANSDVQIIGDGFDVGGSLINWTSGGLGPVLKLSATGAGPSRATLREFSVKGNSGAADCVEIDNADQVGAKVFGEGLNQGGGGTTIGIFADGLTNTLTEIHDHASTVASTAGISSSGTTNVFLGSTFGNAVNTVASTGTLDLVGFWTESPGSGVFSAGQANNSAIVSYAGSQWGFPAANPAAYTFSNFANQGSILEIDIAQNSGDTINIGNLVGSKVLGLGINGAEVAYWNNSGSPTGTTEFLNSVFTNGSGTTQIAESSFTTPFLTSALNLLRTQQPTPPVDQAPGVTDVKMFRVAVSFCRYGIHILP